MRGGVPACMELGAERGQDRRGGGGDASRGRRPLGNGLCEVVGEWVHLDLDDGNRVVRVRIARFRVRLGGDDRSRVVDEPSLIGSRDG